MYKLRSLLAAIAFTTLGFAQSDRGTITGTVADPAGALIPNAQVLIVNQGTGVRLELNTTQTGAFSAPYLSAGLYDVSVEMQGFRKSLQKGVRVQVAQTASVDIVLQIGTASESISVTSEAALLNTESAAASTMRVESGVMGWTPLRRGRLAQGTHQLPRQFPRGSLPAHGAECLRARRRSVW